MFYPGQYMPLGVAPGTPATAVRSGAMISAYLAKEMRNFQDGFYIVLSENVQPCTNRRRSFVSTGISGRMGRCRWFASWSPDSIAFKCRSASSASRIPSSIRASTLPCCLSAVVNGHHRAAGQGVVRQVEGAPAAAVPDVHQASRGGTFVC